MKKCQGCGVSLQDQDPTQRGYTPDLSLALCQRCFRIRHYNDPLFGKETLIKREEVLAKLRDLAALYVLVVDVLNLEHSFKADLCAVLAQKRVIVIVNKYDLPAENVNTAKFESYLQSYIRSQCAAMKLIGIIITQQKDHDFKERFLALLRMTPDKEAVMIGNVNVGKSTLINKLKDDNALTVSRFPSTTLALLKCQVGEYVIYDTPGLTDPGSILSILAPKYLKKFLPRHIIHPQTFQFNSEESYLLEGLVRIDVKPLKAKAAIIFHLEKGLKVQRVKKKNADAYLVKHQAEWPWFTELKPNLSAEEGRDLELVLNGLGVIALKGVGQFQLYLPDKLTAVGRKGVF